MAGRNRILDRTRVIGLLVTLAAIAAEVPLGALAFGDRVLWAHGLFEFLLCVLVVGIAMLIMGDHFEEPGGETSGNDGVGLGGR